VICDARKARDLVQEDTISYKDHAYSVVGIQQVSCQVWVTVRELPDGEPFELPATFPEIYEFPILTGLIPGRDGALCPATISQATIEAWPHKPIHGDTE
jgi:hypothetical protein